MAIFLTFHCPILFGTNLFNKLHDDDANVALSMFVGLVVLNEL